MFQSGAWQIASLLFIRQETENAPDILSGKESLQLEGPRKSGPLNLLVQSSSSSWRKQRGISWNLWNRRKVVVHPFEASLELNASFVPWECFPWVPGTTCPRQSQKTTTSPLPVLSFGEWHRELRVGGSGSLGTDSASEPFVEGIARNWTLLGAKSTRVHPPLMEETWRLLAS